MWLLLDIGNSRLKWAYSDGAELRLGGAAHRTNTPLPAAALDVWRAGIKPLRVVAANVAGPAVAEALQAWTRDTWHIEPEFLVAQARGHGVVNGYAAPERLGVDRWAALVAVRQMQRGALCVVDCGSAVTFDVLDADGAHRGGAILPGMSMMQRALIEHTHGIFAGVRDGRTALHAGALAHDTATAIGIGTELGLAGAVERLISEAEKELGTALQCVVCGGDAPVLMEHLTRSCLHGPDLVLEGVRVMAAGVAA